MPHSPGASCHEKIVAGQRRPIDPEDRFLLPGLKADQPESKYRMLKTETARFKPRGQFSRAGYSPPDKKTMTFISVSYASASDGVGNIFETTNRQWPVTLEAINGKFFELFKPPTRPLSGLAFDKADISCHMCVRYLSGQINQSWKPLKRSDQRFVSTPTPPVNLPEPFVVQAVPL